MTRAAVYCRVSTEEQALEGYSIAAQKEVLENYCIAQDYEIWRVYVDDGYSGRNTNRPGYRQMMEEIDSWDIMLVLKMDRIHRNSRNFMNMMDLLGRKHKEFVSATESLDTTNAMGRFVMAMIQNIAQLESEQIGERTYMGMKQKAETMSNTERESRTMGMNPPYGYELEDGVVRSIPEELERVRGVFMDYAKGMSQTDIAEELNRDGVRTRRGKRWTAYSVGTLLHNPVYAGYMRWNGVLYRHYAGTAVSPTDFNEVQKLAVSKEKDPSKRKEPLLVPEDDFERPSVLRAS
ncbi:MAG: recombinase family protein [Methanomethylophilus sp.]|jgi:DNA invertase Pin-like site-specific DNA recombinase